MRATVSFPAVHRRAAPRTLLRSRREAVSKSVSAGGYHCARFKPTICIHGCRTWRTTIRIASGSAQEWWCGCGRAVFLISEEVAQGLLDLTFLVQPAIHKWLLGRGMAHQSADALSRPLRACFDYLFDRVQKRVRLLLLAAGSRHRHLIQPLSRTGCGGKYFGRPQLWRCGQRSVQRGSLHGGPALYL